jgi:gliding motility-associated-like protein
MKQLYLIFLLTLTCGVGFAQKLTTEGKDFWMGFMENLGTPEKLRLFITSKKTVTGTVSIPRNNWSLAFSVNANATLTIDLPVNFANTTGTGFKNTGVHIVSNDTISVFAINNLVNTTDAAVILPTPSLGVGADYIISSFDANVGQSEFLIVGVQDDTPVKITSPTGVVETITIDQGQTYQKKSATDLTGTKVESTDPCKTFALFAGVECVQVPTGCARCDHIYEQMYPTFTWDKNYLVAPFGKGTDSNGNSLVQSGGYLVRIIRTNTTTTATINGTPVSWNSGGGRFHQHTVNSYAPLCITASDPVAVVQYMKGQGCNGLPQVYECSMECIAKGDPAMLLINPNSQTVRSAVFNTVTTNNMRDHFVNLVVKTTDIGLVTLDNNTVADINFTTFPNCNEYSFAALKISIGSHVVSCPTGLIAYCYGIGPRESYAYTAGASFENLEYLFSTQDTYNFSTAGIGKGCLGLEITFAGVNGDNVISRVWDFGDGSPTATGESVTHTYTGASTYNAKMTLTVQTGCGATVFEITRPITIYPYPDTVLPNVSFCTGASVVLDAGEFGAGTQYLWSNGATTREINVNQIGGYSVLITNPASCSFTTNTATVSETPLPVINLNNLPAKLCINASSFALASVASPNDPANSTFTINNVSNTIFNPAVLGAGVFEVKFTYQNPATLCSNSTTKSVTINPLPTVSFVNLANSYCVDAAAFDLQTKVNPSGGAFTLNGQPVTVFNPAILTAGTTYLLAYAYTDGITQCQAAISQNITIQPLPTVAFTNLENAYCQDFGVLNLFNTVNPSSTTSGVFSLNGNTLTTAQAQGFNTTTLTSGQSYAIGYTYQEAMTNCAKSIQKNILINPLPTVNFVGLQASYCPTAPAFSLNSVVDRVGGTFTLNGNPATQFNPAILTAGQAYTLQYTYTDPQTTCSRVIQAQVSITPPPQFIDLNTVYCQNGGIFTLNGSPSGGTFRINGNVVTDLNPALYPAGNITITYTDAQNCALATASFEIVEDIAPITVFVLEDICSQFGEAFPVTLDATQGIADVSGDVSYNWVGLNTTTQTVKVTRSGAYQVIVKNDLNCEEERNFVLRERQDCTPFVVAPNAFTPNADGLNDVFEVIGKYLYDYKMTVYNRWGEIVFQTKKLTEGWDGTVRGKDAPAGVYICLVEYRKLPQSERFTGQTSVRLIR